MAILSPSCRGLAAPARAMLATMLDWVIRRLLGRRASLVELRAQRPLRPAGLGPKDRRFEKRRPRLRGQQACCRQLVSTDRRKGGGPERPRSPPSTTDLNSKRFH